MVEKKQTITKAGGVIFNHDKTKLLIVHQMSKGKPAKWGCPKGHKKNNELYYHCAFREMYEELGIKIRTNNNDPKIKVGNTLYYPYIVKDIDINLIPVDKLEICEIRLINPEDTEEIDKNYELKKIINNIDIFREKAIPSYIIKK
tara:strand:- start:2898 stop:3332 length:435 start_codon:yes stop_codon:yes gene_type:complete